MAKKVVKPVAKAVSANGAETGVVGLLTTLLADEVVLYTKLRNYHWNVTGVHFTALHAEFERQYDEIALVVDEVAELIRQYRANAIGTMEEFKQHARLKEEAPGSYPDADTMVATIAADHDMLVSCLRDDIEKVDEESDDVAVEDFLTTVLEQHLKLGWMTRVLLEGKTKDRR